jgi:hypothetical protein
MPGEDMERQPLKCSSTCVHAPMVRRSGTVRVMASKRSASDGSACIGSVLLCARGSSRL